MATDNELIKDRKGALVGKKLESAVDALFVQTGLTERTRSLSVEKIVEKTEGMTRCELKAISDELLESGKAVTVPGIAKHMRVIVAGIEPADAGTDEVKPVDDTDEALVSEDDSKPCECGCGCHEEKAAEATVELADAACTCEETGQELCERADDDKQCKCHEKDKKKSKKCKCTKKGKKCKCSKKDKKCKCSKGDKKCKCHKSDKKHDKKKSKKNKKH